METYEKLEKALALIEREENWCGDGWGWDGMGSQWESIKPGRCALHAIASAHGSETGFPAEASPAHHALLPHTPASVGVFNDSHTHAEVVALFQTAIRAEKQKAGIPVELPVEEAVAA